MCKVLSAEPRVRIVQLLKRQVLCVGALAGRLGITQGAVSQHLRILRDAGLVASEKRGYYVHYRIRQDALREWQGELDELLSPPASGPRPTAQRAKTKGATARSRKA
jgi:DNA-binding transcriptional ArsR family regulator